MTTTYRIILTPNGDVEYRSADRASAQALADAVNVAAKAGMRGLRAVVVRDVAIGRFAADAVQRAVDVMRAGKIPPPRTGEPGGPVTKSDAMAIVQAYGHRDGRLFARHASAAERRDCLLVRRYRDGASDKTRFDRHRTLTPIVGPFFHRRKMEWRTDGHVLGSYVFDFRWFADGFLDGLFE